MLGKRRGERKLHTSDRLLGEEVVFHRFHRVHSKRPLQGLRRVLEYEPPRERRIILFDGLDLMPNATSDVNEYDCLRIVSEALGDAFSEREEIEPAVPALALTSHPEHESFVVCRMLGKPFEKGILRAMAELERIIRRVGWVLVFCFLQE